MKSKHLAKLSLNDLVFSVVDVETTGMSASSGRVIDVGIVKVQGGQIINKWESLIDPEQEIPHWISYFTKITNKHVKGQPKFANLADKIISLLEDTVFVAHNVYFDYLFLYYEMKRLGLDFSYPKLCTVMLGRKLLPDLPSASLDCLSKFYNIKIKNRHRALPDAEATAIILNNFINMAKSSFQARNYFDLEKIQWRRAREPATKFSGSLFSTKF